MPKADRPLTWAEKLEKRQRLNTLETVQADADFNFKEHLRRERAKAEFEELKNRGYDEPEDDAEATGKKGSK